MAQAASETPKVRYFSGDVIVPACEAFFKFLDPIHKETRCNTCFRKKNDLTYCFQCHNVRYCDDACRQKDIHNGHGLECTSKSLRLAMRHRDQESAILLFRLHALLRTNPGIDKKPYVMHDGTTRCFNDLEAHEVWGKDALTRRMCENLALSLREGDADEDVSSRYFIRLQGIFQSNVVQIREWGEPIGIGIFVERAPFGHSCKPTANCYTMDGRMEIRAMVPILEGVGPLISYVDLSVHSSTHNRQKTLMQQYAIDCKCEKCRQEMIRPFDYHALRESFRKLESHLRNPATCILLEWRSICTQHTMCLKRLRSLFHQYDQVVTMFSYKVLIAILNGGVDDSHTCSLKMAVANQLNVTFGLESFDIEMLAVEHTHLTALMNQ